MMEQSMYPVLRYTDARAAIDWLSRAFGFTAKQVHEGPDGAIQHAELESESGVVMVTQMPASGQSDRWGQPAGSGFLYAVVSDPDAHHERARQAGAEIVMEPTDQDYGSRDYAARDFEGNLWSFGTYKPS
jgi:uncharacterized glyoxalase superfamily protein PhnB